MLGAHGSGAVELREKLAQHNKNRCTGHGELAGMNLFERRIGIAIRSTRFGVDDPDILHPKAAILGGFILHDRQSVFRRENLNGNQRLARNVAFEALPGPGHQNIWNAEIRGRSLGAQFRKNLNSPLWRLIAKRTVRYL